MERERKTLKLFLYGVGMTIENKGQEVEQKALTDLKDATLLLKSALLRLGVDVDHVSICLEKVDVSFLESELKVRNTSASKFFHKYEGLSGFKFAGVRFEVNT